MPGSSLASNELITVRVDAVDINHEVSQLIAAIKQHGSTDASGKTSCAYGVLFDKTANILEALNGTLRAAKRQKKVAFDKELLLMPADKDVLVSLVE